MKVREAIKLREAIKPVTSSRVSSRGQIVIPSRIRERYHITTGTEVRFEERGGEVILQPITDAHIDSLRGILKGKSSLVKELLKERKLERDREDTPRRTRI